VTISSTFVVSGQSSATVAWLTNKPADSTVIYGTSPAALGSSVSDPVMSTSHALILRGLMSGVQYYYRVASKTDTGGAGRWPDDTSPPASFRLTPGPMMVSPGLPPPRE
jgi:hypothetical protein